MGYMYTQRCWSRFVGCTRRKLALLCGGPCKAVSNAIASTPPETYLQKPDLALKLHLVCAWPSSATPLDTGTVQYLAIPLASA